MYGRLLLMVLLGSAWAAGACSAFFFFFQAEDGIRDLIVTGVQTCALPIFHQRARVLAAMTRMHAITPEERAEAERTPLEAPGDASTERQATVSAAAQGAKEIGRASCRERG